jgi:hypothetical protein
MMFLHYNRRAWQGDKKLLNAPAFAQLLSRAKGITLMVKVEDFRSGTFGVSFACVDELPACCFRCWYLIHEESQVCFCEAPFYYYCCYSWPDKLTQTVPPCLAEGAEPGIAEEG